MHLPVGDTRPIDDGEAAADLAQSPADLVMLSAADTELAALSGAARRGGESLPSLRLANLARLGHPLSVDLYVERTVSHAGLVVVRLMGGLGYWSYGAEQFRSLSRGGGPALAVIPGEDRWDATLEDYCTLPVEKCRALWRYFVEGGPTNMDRALGLMRSLVGRGEAPPPAERLARAGCYLPGTGIVSIDKMAERTGSRPVVPLVFYRALLQGDSAAPVDALAAALEAQGLAALPVFVASLRDAESEAYLVGCFARLQPAVVLNATAFAASQIGIAHAGTVLDRPGRPVLQVIFAGSTEEAWQASARGLSSKDLTMNVVLPEVDGRIISRAVSFKEEAFDPFTECRISRYRPVPGRVAFVAAQAAAWARLGSVPAAEKRVALVLSNYPNRDGRIGNGVGLDTPESTIRIVQALRLAGYVCGAFPDDRRSLMRLLLAGPTNALPTDHFVSSAEAGDGLRGAVLSVADYRRFFDALPEAVRLAVTQRWGAPESDPHVRGGAFVLAIHRFGNLVVGIQPARGYNIDPKATYHDPALPPPHHYFAFHTWLRTSFGVDAIVHVGKHGNLEWLPGKALGLSAACFPEAVLGPVPLIYPFIVNDPGEGAQAKRRASAVVVDHLMPALARAETYGPLAELETLIDEYYFASTSDPRRAAHLSREIRALAASSGLDHDLGFAGQGEGETLRLLDAHLCELKELQIRDGLHILGESPAGAFRASTLAAIARATRPGGRPADAALPRAIAADLALGPLDGDLAAPWAGPWPPRLVGISSAPWRTAGDTVERVELLALEMIEGLSSVSASTARAPGAPARETSMPATAAVLGWIAGELAPALDRSGAFETAGVLAALDGRFVPPGPSGAPSRGRPEVLPTGRNFYSVDTRAVPTQAAYAIGQASAEALVLRYFQDEGNWPRAIAISAWGTANMRTGGDDIAEALALAGVRPFWEPGTGRVTGFTVLSLAELGRPRVDVTFRISGMFRDAFPDQVDLLDSAFRAVAGLDEPAEANPLAASVREAERALVADGTSPALARRRAETRVFGSAPGAYGAGMQALIDEGIWTNRADFAEAYLAWGGFAYGGGAAGESAHDLLRARLARVEAVVHNQDNREHDILDSDDYYQFHGGLAATVEALRGSAPRLYHGDHSRPEKPVVRALSEEIARVVRARAANPKWIAGMMRHGYKGAFEMAATVDYLFAFAATTNAVADHHFDQLFAAYVGDEAVRSFIAVENPPVLAEMARRFEEAIRRDLWHPASNSARELLAALAVHDAVPISRTMEPSR